MARPPARYMCHRCHTWHVPESDNPSSRKLWTDAYSTGTSGGRGGIQWDSKYDLCPKCRNSFAHWFAVVRAGSVSVSVTCPAGVLTPAQREAIAKAVRGIVDPTGTQEGN